MCHGQDPEQDEWGLGVVGVRELGGGPGTSGSKYGRVRNGSEKDKGACRDA